MRHESSLWSNMMSRNVPTWHTYVHSSGIEVHVTAHATLVHNAEIE